MKGDLLRMELEEYRKEIDEIDEQLVALIARRMAVSEKIGRFKAQNGMEIYVPAREQEKLDVLRAASNGYPDETEEIYRLMFRLSRELQQRITGV